MYETEDLSIRSTNISWSFSPSEAIENAYTLTILNSTDSTVFFGELDHLFYVFSAPDNAPPCEVYNFSVTATPVGIGANYTGDGCSVSGSVLSRMLPSLPDIQALNNSIDFSLTKRTDEGNRGSTVYLNVKFMVSFLFIQFELRLLEMISLSHLHILPLPYHVQHAKYCEEYPVLNYTLTVNDSTHGSHLQTTVMTMEGTNLVEMSQALSEDAIVTFKVSANNRFASAETNPVTIREFT